ncbi:MAG: hypothetical protein IH897_04975 [Planctomycetes bacterium]|nr:hypothetical protein [Planctomycetota bacterium]
MIAADMNRLFFVMLVLMLGGCGALPASTLQPEDSGRRLVGDSGGFSAGGSDEDSVDFNPSDDVVGAPTDEPPVNPIRTDDSELADAAAGAAQDSADRVDDDSLIDIPGGLPIDPFLPEPPDTVEPIDLLLLDLGLFPGMDLELFVDFLPFLTDSLLLDALAPSGSSSSASFADSFSHLELLCLDLDLPKSFCRGRYGN